MKIRQTSRITTVVLGAVFAGAVSSSFATEEQIAELEAEIAELTASIVAVEEESGGVSQLKANLEAAGKEIEAAKESLPARERSIGGKEFLLAAYQSAFRVVTKFTPGENLGGFVLKNGETVEPCSFVSAGNGVILVQGATGSRSIPLAMLPDTFSNRILLPPASVEMTTSLAAIKEAKPESILTAEDKKKVVAKTTSGGGSAGAAAAGGTAPADAATDFEAIRKRNEARQREIAELKLQFADLFTQKRISRSEKANAEKVFREAKIKKSQSEISSTLKMHDDKISRIEMQENELRQQISRLQSQLE
jgi:septal ring factor EnvC (AmiA/AmiB activator)